MKPILFCIVLCMYTTWVNGWTAEEIKAELRKIALEADKAASAVKNEAEKTRQSAEEVEVVDDSQGHQELQALYALGTGPKAVQCALVQKTLDAVRSRSEEGTSSCLERISKLADSEEYNAALARGTVVRAVAKTLSNFVKACSNKTKEEEASCLSDWGTKIEAQTNDMRNRLESMRELASIKMCEARLGLNFCKKISSIYSALIREHLEKFQQCIKGGKETRSVFHRSICESDQTD